MDYLNEVFIMFLRQEMKYISPINSGGVLAAFERAKARLELYKLKGE